MTLAQEYITHLQDAGWARGWVVLHPGDKSAQKKVKQMRSAAIQHPVVDEDGEPFVTMDDSGDDESPVMMLEFGDGSVFNENDYGMYSCRSLAMMEHDDSRTA